MPLEVRRVQGIAVHVSGQGPGVVLLHANGGDHLDFAEVIPALSRRRTVYAVDWPGHGESDPALDASAIAASAAALAVAAAHAGQAAPGCSGAAGSAHSV